MNKAFAKASYLFSTKNIDLFQILMFKIFTKRYLYNIVSFEQPDPEILDELRLQVSRFECTYTSFVSQGRYQI